MFNAINEETTMQTQQQLNVYGMTQQDIRDQYIDSITTKLSGIEMTIAGILSDAQELMAMGHTEAARKQLNVAKFILFETQDAKRAA